MMLKVTMKVKKSQLCCHDSVIVFLDTFIRVNQRQCVEKSWPVFNVDQVQRGEAELYLDLAAVDLS